MKHRHSSSRSYALLLWLLIAVAGVARADGTYAYGPNRQSELVRYPSGSATLYNYDESGRLLSIVRSEANQLTILQADKIAGPVGSSVTLSGTAFCSDPVVTFNGMPATVVSSTSTDIEVRVPHGATNGRLQVACGSNHASGPDFKVANESISSSAPFFSLNLNAGFDLPRDEIPGLQEAALRGSGTSALRLSHYYGYTHDHPAAMRWLTIAAEDGDPAGMYNLAYRLLDGRDPKETTSREDEIRARFWLERLATAGDGPAREMLREMGNRGL